MKARMLPAYFDPIRTRVSETLRRFLMEKREELARVNPMGPDVAERLLDFSLRGKMIRGCLVHLGWSLCRPSGSKPPIEDDDAVSLAGAAMELFQSGLLVHDDIMDRDLVRRGRPSIFQQYAETADLEGRTDPFHVGEALGICAGDVAYFLAFELLARVEAPPRVHAAVLSLCARELSAVGIAQMQDVAWGASKSGVNVQDILRMYTWKTGRYSFSLPLATGALLAGASRALQETLEKYGESLGLLFQMRDDELGLFANENELGKPVGSDIREGKKTILFSSIAESAGPAERARFEDILGNPHSSPADIEFVRGLASSPEVRARIDAITAGLTAKAQTAVDAVSCGSDEDHAALRGLLDFTVGRGQ